MRKKTAVLLCFIIPNFAPESKAAPPVRIRKKQKPHTGAFGKAYELLPAPDDEGAAVAAEANVIFLGE